MCGIAGLFSEGGAQRDWLRSNISRMTAALQHRGPDGGGVWIDARAGIALGHRRLAILDLSDAGDQPMTCASGRWMITFNGEIYNYRELRRNLETRGCQFRSTTDTEVILAAVDTWGIEESLRVFDGMFAFGLWDRQERSLILARDRFGEKPLYYARQRNTILFASELSALEQVDGFERKISEAATVEFLRRGYIPAPLAIYEHSRKLEAGHWMQVDDAPRRYWRIAPPAIRNITFTDAVEELDRRLRQAIHSRLISDVEVGAFLSGGVDSGAIAAMMTGARTFTIGFTDPRFDESRHAAAVARHLGMKPEEWIVTPEDAMRVIPNLADIYSEPFADSSQIPTFLVSHLASRSVKVVLTGDGGDELFAGYPRYWQLQRLARMPAGVRHAAAGMLRRFAKAEKTQLLAEIMSARDLAAMYQVLMGGSRETAQVEDPLLWMTIHDLENYLADDLLVKVDRAAMRVGLETRLPFLDPSLLEFALSLPVSLRANKRVLKTVLARYVPSHLFDRPKQGFMLPIADWLRRPLRDWAEDLVPGISNQLPAGSRCVRAWSHLMLAAWLRRPGLQEPIADLPLVSVADPA